MAPTEILARQHFMLAKKIFPKNITIALISGKSEYKIKKEIHQRLENNKIDIIFGTHAIFQKKVIFKKLGLIIIDEQLKSLFISSSVFCWSSVREKSNLSIIEFCLFKLITLFFFLIFLIFFLISELTRNVENISSKASLW